MSRVQELRVLPLAVWARQHPGSSVNFSLSHFKRDIDEPELVWGTVSLEPFKAMSYQLYRKVVRMFNLKKNDLAKCVSDIFM